MGKLSLTRAERNIAWIEEHCRIPEGKFVGQPLKMAEFMRDDFRSIYDNPAGTRRAIISRGRKNAKTTESAFIVLLHTCGPEARENSQLFSAAQSRDQAAILFNLAAKMVRLSPTLNEFVGIRDTAKQIYCGELGTLYRALSADATTAYGLSPVLIVHDELGQVKGPRSELYEALETATAAQEEPLSIVISTQAPTESDLLSVLIDDAKEGNDPRTVLRFQTAPPDMDPFSEEAIRAANPGFDVFMNKREVLAMAEDARRMPSRQAEYENLVLNRRVETNNPFVSKAVWDACGGEVADDFDGPVYIGLDLSETSDLTALVMVSPVDGKWHVKPTFWLPSQGLNEKARADRVPYDVWHKQGVLDTTPGPAIEYEYIAGKLRQVFDKYEVRQVAFDRWGFRHLRPWLVKAGFADSELERFVEFGQGFQSMSPALRDLEANLLTGKILHGQHPVLTMCAANAVVQSDPAGNRKLTKAKSRGRIDGMVSLAMAMAVVATEDLEGPGYTETHGVYVI
ncbi:MAG: terminase [Alphaproteobacteria bacterium]|nr:terminase [Alphaproteobacteria bacterium]MBO6629157.1 terminase [Alphaproteobacteria bacterium]